MSKQGKFYHSVLMSDNHYLKKNINEPEINPNLDNCIVIATTWAIKNGHTVILDLLLNDPRTNDQNQFNISFKKAVEAFSHNILNSLFKNDNTNPSFDNNWAISYAYENNREDIVKLLWTQDKVKSTLKEDNLKLYRQLIQPSVKEKIKSF
jgi:hypothetical protein